MVFRKAINVLGVLAIVGFVAWAALVWIPGRSESEMFGVYVAVCVTVAVAASLLSSVRSIAVSLAVFAPALAIGWWTIPRGHNDGLWLLYYPLLVACVPAAVLACLAARWLERRWRQP